MKHLFIATLLFLSSQVRGQFAVMDVGVVASVTKQILEVKKSTEVLTKSHESLTKMKNALQKANDYLGTISNMVAKARYFDKFQRLNHRARAAQERTNRHINQIYGHLSEGKLRRFLSSSQYLLDGLSDDFTLIQEVLKPFKAGGPKMNDFERLTYLDRKLKQTEARTLEIESQEQSLLDMASMERVLHRIK